MAATTSDLRIDISADRLSATLCAEPSALSRSWEIAELKALCQKIGLPFGEAMTARVEPLLDVKKRPQRKDRFEIAVGVAPIAMQPRWLEQVIPCGSVVSAGVAVLRIVDQVLGKDGTDVFGRPITHEIRPESVLRVGERLVQKEASYVSTEPGLVRVVDGVPLVETVQLFAGNIDPISGDVDSADNVSVTGSIKDGAKVKSSRSVIVKAAIEAAQVSAGHDVVVGGGVIQRRQGKLTAGGSVKARFIQDAIIECAGDLTVETEITHSKLIVGGRLIAGNATLLTVDIHAVGGLEANVIGTDAISKGFVAVGCDPSFQKAFDEIMPIILANRKRTEHVRKMVAPLMKNQKQLTSQQKEKATELLFDADQLQQETDEKFATLKKRFDALQRVMKPEIVVRGEIAAGTTLRFPGVETTLRSTLKGPFRIALEGATAPRIMFYFDGHQSGNPLESRPVVADAVFQMTRQLALLAGAAKVAA
jgi:Flagellar Assembly Protein A